jgi:hypothetical protein
MWVGRVVVQGTVTKYNKHMKCIRSNIITLRRMLEIKWRKVELKLSENTKHLSCLPKSCWQAEIYSSESPTQPLSSATKGQINILYFSTH